MSNITIIVAIAQNRAIGRDQSLLCYLPNDLKRFKTLTSGHTVIMGRKTYLSLPNGALPNRRNIVLTSDQTAQYPNAEVCHSLPEALSLIAPDEAAFIMGGASVYAEALPLADRLCLTQIDHTFEDADTFFPEIDFSQWQEVSREHFDTDQRHPYAYTFVDYERK